jgi:hypothetical protein
MTLLFLNKMQRLSVVRTTNRSANISPKGRYSATVSIKENYDVENPASLPTSLHGINSGEIKRCIMIRFIHLPFPSSLVLIPFFLFLFLCLQLLKHEFKII